MFADQLAHMAQNPYRNNVEAIVTHAIWRFESECISLSNTGVRKINTYLKGESCNYDIGETVFDFNQMECYVQSQNIPKHMSSSICAQVQQRITEELIREGFKSISVRESGCRMALKVYYTKCIEISASW